MNIKTKLTALAASLVLATTALLGGVGISSASAAWGNTVRVFGTQAVCFQGETGLNYCTQGTTGGHAAYSVKYLRVLQGQCVVWWNYKEFCSGRGTSFVYVGPGVHTMSRSR